MPKLRTHLNSLFSKGIVYIRHPQRFVPAAKRALARKRRIAAGLATAARDTRFHAPMQTNPMSTQTLITKLADFMGVINLGNTNTGVCIGVTEGNFISALTFLHSQAHHPKITIQKKPVRFDADNFYQCAFAAQSVKVTFTTPSGVRDVISLEAYVAQNDNLWVSKNGVNTTLRALRDDRLTRTGLTDVRDILGGPTFEMKSRERVIDAVYTWVNHNDPAWAALYAQHKGIASTKTDSAAMTRFHSNDELRYSLRSVFQNAPWINRIYVVTNCARPGWLNADDPRLIWVDHTQIIPNDCLPTFNSHVIESCLHRIPNLAEHFIYLNDDVFLAKRLEKAFFFDVAGASYSFLEHYGMISGEVQEGDADYLNASRNVAALLHGAFAFTPTRLHQHTAFALRKSILAEIEARWQKQFDQLRHHKFRTVQDINLTSFLYHHYAIAQGRAREKNIRNAFVKSHHENWRGKLQNASASSHETICINEGGADTPDPDWHEAVLTFLQQKFPQKATWENDSI